MNIINNLLSNKTWLLWFPWLQDYDFMLRACLAGISISIVAGPLGSLMIWRRLAYFGDTLAHSTLLGLSIALLLNFNIYLGLMLICLLVAVVLASFSKTTWLASDTILSILSHTTLALGLITITSLPEVRVDLLSYLYGDILAVNSQDLYWVFIVVAAVFIALYKLWSALLAVTIHEDLARINGLAVEPIKWSFVIMMALIFAIAMKIIGVLLLTALFVIPPSAARRFAVNPEGMAILGSLFGALAIVIGLLASLHWDFPAGPSIVISAAMLFMLSLFKRKAG